MKFDQKYPEMKPIHEECNGIIRGTSKKPCHQCGEPTEYIEMNYEGHFCSDECLSKFESKME